MKTKRKYFILIRALFISKYKMEEDSLWKVVLSHLLELEELPNELRILIYSFVCDRYLPKNQASLILSRSNWFLATEQHFNSSFCNWPICIPSTLMYPPGSLYLFLTTIFHEVYSFYPIFSTSNQYIIR